MTSRLLYAPLGFILATSVDPAFGFPSLFAEFYEAYEASDHRIAYTTAEDRSPPSLDKAAIAEGIVDRYMLSPTGAIVGLLLRDGSQVYVTRRAAEELIHIIQPGDQVRVHGRRRASTPIVQPDVILNVTDGRSFTVPSRSERPIPPIEDRPRLNEMKAKGTIQILLYDPLKGVVNGVALSDGTQVRLPPDVGEHFHSSLREHLEVEVEGYGTQTQYGRSMRATAIGRKGERLTQLDSSVQELR